jgi:hypothetical protein
MHINSQNGIRVGSSQRGAKFDFGGFKRESCSVVGERYRIPIERDICVDRRYRVLRANKKVPD